MPGLAVVLSSCHVLELCDIIDINDIKVGPLWQL